MASELLGARELSAKLTAMADPKKAAQALKASVAKPMQKVARVARGNLTRISPGKAPFHRTYQGRLVSAGFASRNVIVRTSINRSKTAAFAQLGVRKEAFYAINFFELGTATIGAQPWLVPAFDAQRSATLSGVTASLRESVTKHAKGGSSGVLSRIGRAIS